MIEFNKLINDGLTKETGLYVYLPYQAMSGLTDEDFPLITLEVEAKDGVRNYNKKPITQVVQLEIYLYGNTPEEVLSNKSIVEYFVKVGFEKIHESKLGKTHHWYKSYRFKANVRNEPGDYIIS